MSALGKIRRKILDGDYFISGHMKRESMPDDALETEDIENAILKGRATDRLKHDPRGTRYVIEGPSRDGRQLAVVCRFEGGQLILISVWVVE